MYAPFNRLLIATMMVAGTTGLCGCGTSDSAGTETPAPTQPAAATNTARSTATIPPPTATGVSQPSATALQSTATASSTPTASPTPTHTTATQPTATQGAPGTGKLVFGASNELFMSDLFVINEDGSGRTNVTNTGDASEAQPSWSPDGSKILYRLNDDTIAVMNADGSGKQTILTTTGPLSYPSWSADGSKIVFVADEDLATQHDNTIDVVNVDGTGHMTLLAQKGDYLSPTYSPDGSEIAFAANTTGDAIEIFVMKSDGTALTQITHHGDNNDGTAWSPTTDEIAFTNADAITFEGGIAAIRSDGTGMRIIVPTGGGNPAWSRDGTRLAFDVFNEGIAVVNADGSGRHIVPNTSDGFDPDLD